LTEKEKVEVMILSDELDSNYKVKVGVKQLSDGEWREFFNKNKPGDIIPIKIKRIGEKGINAEISKNIEGFIKISEVSEEKISAEDLSKNIKVGDKKEAVILNTYPDKKRIYLSLKAASKKKEREDIEKYLKSSNDKVTTIGDLLQNEIDKTK
jgi:small subunit ribosomal protein S1